jgi:hypothetical protein
MDNFMTDYEELTPDQIAEEAQERINKAADLQFTVNTKGWNTLLATFEEMKDAQIANFMAIPPGSANEKDIIAAHNVAYTTAFILNEVVNATNRAIQDGFNAQAELQSFKNPEVSSEWE